jgi:hypothetical protein
MEAGQSPRLVRATEQTTMDKQHDSHLFTVRLWAEELGDGQIEWRGKLQHVTSGEARYFRDWPVLIALLQAMLPGDTLNSKPDGEYSQS